MTRRFWPKDTWYWIRNVTRLVGTEERWGMPPGPVTFGKVLNNVVVLTFQTKSDPNAYF